MKVIIVNRFYAPDQSATSRMCESLALGLTGLGYKVEAIASATHHDDAGVALPRRENIVGVEVFRVAGTRFGRARLFGRAMDYLTFHFGAAWLLFRRASAGDICVVCTDPPLMAVSAWPSIRARRALLVNWLQDIFPEVAFEAGVVRSDGWLAWLILAARDATIRAADANVAPTQRMVAGLRSRIGDGAKIDVVPQWSDGEAIAPRSTGKSRLRSEWGLGGKFVVGYSGNLGRAHDFTTMIDAAEILGDDDRIRFLIVGGGHRLEWVRQEAERRGLRNFVFRPLQPVDRLADCLAAADVHFVTLLPDFEPLIIPSKFYGVAAAGRGVLFVGAADGEVASLLAQNGCGAAFPIGDSDGLASEIRRLADDPTAAAEWGRIARDLFDARFTRHRGVSDWRTILERRSGGAVAAGVRETRERAA